MAFTWACERLSDYLVGMSFHIHTDHKPLVPLFSSKRLEDLPTRVQRFRLRMLQYDYTISHVPGKELIVANTLSRALINNFMNIDSDLHQEVESYVSAVKSYLPVSEKRIESIRNHQHNDVVCQKILHYYMTGWPERRNLIPTECRPYCNISAKLSVNEGILMRLNRIVIPTALRSGIFKEIHTGHQGISTVVNKLSNVCGGQVCLVIYWRWSSSVG